MKIQSVSEINRKIKNLIEDNFYSSVSVRGEISNFSISPSGHSYFVLKDDSSKIKSVMFKGYMNSLAGYIPKNGDKVIVTGDIKIYEPDGVYQVIVKKMTYDSIGDFYKKFEEVKRKLEAEDLFNEDRKKKPNQVIRKIALITSKNGAAIKDFLITLENNNISLDIDLYPVMVQGDTAIPSIIRAISEAGNMDDTYDALVIMRGGGSIEDLSIFNDEDIARALSNSKVPTISAIGHERDISICDFVADVRVATPTAAAEFISEGILNYLNELNKIQENLKKLMQINLLKYYQMLDSNVFLIEKNSPLTKLILYKEQLENTSKSIYLSMITSINTLKQEIEILSQKIKNQAPDKKISFYKQSISNNKEFIINYMLTTLKDRTYEYDNIKIKFYNSVNFWLEKTKNEINFYELIIKNSNYLDKGYALIKNKDKVISSINSVNLEDNLEIILKDGYIDCFVDGKRKK
jgi:exodeoxyribonuclease VII large subunit